MKYGFVIDNRKCIGCHACTTACKSEHDVPVGVFRTWVKQVEKGDFPHTRRVFSVMRCNHCTDAPCVEICPVEALYFRPDGIVDFDNNRCIGCKSCMQACPYDALYIDPETHTAAKCNYCAHRVDVGLEPACVNVCPEHAIISGDMDNPGSEISQLLGREQVTVRKQEKGTNPNLFYINGDHASLNPAATEKPNITLWGEQTRGVGHFAKNTEKLAFQGNDLVTAAMESNGSATSAEELKNTEGGFKSVDVLMGKNRRVYDVPNKGLLWGWEVSTYVWTKAISAGAFLIPFLAFFFGKTNAVSNETWLWGIGVSMVFLILTTVFLVKDLDQPMRFFYVVLRPQWKSWLVRGGYALTLFGGMLSLVGVTVFFGLGIPVLPLLWATAVLAVLTAVYTAFLFAQAKGRDFWQSPTLVLHMLVHSIMAGAAAFGLVEMFVGGGLIGNGFLTNCLLIGVAFNLLTITAELVTTHPTADAKTVVKMITKGRYSKLFWTGVILVGNVLPFVLLIAGVDGMLPVASVLVLLGIYFTEKIWVEAPQNVQLS